MNGACRQCLRRQLLLGLLSRRLDVCARDLTRFWQLLELSDPDTIDAVGGRSRSQLHLAYRRFAPEANRQHDEIQMSCRHSYSYPLPLRNRKIAPHALGVRGDVERLAEMLEAPVVAIVGARRASDYGVEIASELARGLTACGLTVASGLADGVAVAAHSGALNARGATFTVTAGGLKHRCSPKSCAALYRRLTSEGCALSETPPDLPIHYWGILGQARTLALLANLVIVVEAEERPSELACAWVARALGTPVAAVPGRVSSRASSGSNRLLMDGARLVRNAQDALDLLYGGGTLDTVGRPEQLEPALQAVIERVSDGQDTLAKLTAHEGKPAETALALTELELRDLLRRGDGGRYVLSGPLPAGTHARGKPAPSL